MSPGPALLLIGHGSRSAAGVDEYWQFADVLRSEANGLEIGCGFIELAEPDLDAAIDALVGRGATSIGAVPLVLLGAGHMKNDGPAALERGRRRHQGVRFEYGRSLGIHPLVLALAEDRIRAAVGADDPGELAVVLVGRGSSDPDANADLYKVGRLLQDSRGWASSSRRSSPWRRRRCPRRSNAAAASARRRSRWSRTSCSPASSWIASTTKPTRGLRPIRAWRSATARISARMPASPGSCSSVTGRRSRARRA